MTQTDAFHLPLALWTTPPSKLLKEIARKGRSHAVDASTLAAPILEALGRRDGVVVRVADAPVDQAQLTVRCAGIPDAPFPMVDVAGILVAAAASAASDAQVLACRAEVEAALPLATERLLPPTGFLIVASGPKAEVLRWYAAALRALRVAGVGLMARPGYEPSNVGRSAALTRGVLPTALRAAFDRAGGLPYASTAMLLPMSIVPPDEALTQAA